MQNTQANLKHATAIELTDIDRNYPAALDRLRAENHAETMMVTTYSWQSERQHRDLVREIQSGTGLFFNQLKKEIEENPRTYYICLRCGSILTELPTETCPICNSPASNYSRLNKPK